MKISTPLNGCTKMLRNITKSIKNYAQGGKGWKSRLDAVYELNDQQTPTPNRQYKVKKAMKYVFRSRSRKASCGGTIPIMGEQSSETHYSPPIFEGARSEAQAPQTRYFSLTTQHGLPAHFIDEALDRSIAALRGDVSFVDSGYGIDLVSYERDLASSTGAYIEECGSFLNHDADPAFLTGAGNDERGSFLPVADEMIPVVSDGEVDEDGPRSLGWIRRDDSGVLPPDGGLEQGSSRNATSTSWDDENPNVVLEPPQEPEPKFVEEQDLHTFSFHVSESGWKANNGPLSPELSPMSMDFPALNSLPFEPSMTLPHYQIRDEQVPQGDLLSSEPPMAGTRSAPSQKGAAIDWSLLLPTELLQEIFFHALPNQVSPTDWKLGTPWPRPSRGAALLDLRRVCRRWNDAVLSPCVWDLNAVAWSVATSTKPDSRARLGCIKLHSRWAHSAPIDAISYEIGNELMTPISDEIMDAVYRSIVNCRFARIVLPERDIVDTDLIQLYPDCAQEMSRLRVLSWTSPYSIDTILPSRWRLPWTSLRQAPWPQLTACFINCPLEMEDCLFILQECPGLKTVELNRIFSSGITSNNVPGSSPVHENLSSLRVSSTVDIDILISNIQLPNLTNFQLDLTSGGNDEPFQQLQRLNLPWASLESLTLKCPMALSDAYQLFSVCHSITKLEWHWPDVGETLVPVLAADFPLIGLNNLKSLTITPTLSHHDVQSLLETMAVKILSSTELTLPSLPLNVWDSLEAFTNLTTLTLTGPIFASQCLLIMKWMKRLRRLDVLVGDMDASLLDTWTDSVNPEQLKDLTLRTPINNLELLFRAMTLPSLTSFVLTFEINNHSDLHWAGDHRYGDYQQGLYPLLCRSRTPLEHLFLNGISIKAVDLEGILNTATSRKTEVRIIDVNEIPS